MNNTYHHGNLRDQMIEKGIELIAEEGIQNFSLRKVAKLCNVSHTAPYRHFSCKEELLDAIAFYGMKRFAEKQELAILQFPDNPQDQLNALGRMYVEFAIENPNLMRTLFTREMRRNLMRSDGPHYMSHGFGALENCIDRCLTLPNFRFNDRHSAIIAAWSMVHGLSMLLIEEQLSELSSSEEIVNTFTTAGRSMFFD